MVADMNKLFIALLLLLGTCTIHAQTLGSYNGQCSKGDIQANVQGLLSSNFFIGSYPLCTVSVYYTGTTNLVPGAQVYANASGSSTLGNPFTANADGSFLLFVAAGAGYDITLSGGGLSAPVTITDVVPLSFPFVTVSPTLSIQSAINLCSSGGSGLCTVIIPPSTTEYACPTSLVSNLALIGLGAFADAAFVGSINLATDVTSTQVWIGPCGSISVPIGAQNIRLQNLTLDFNGSGYGLSFVSTSLLQLYGVTIRNAGNSTTPGLSLTAVNANGNTVHPILSDVFIQCQQSSYCSAALYLGGGSTTAVTNGQFTNLSVSGNVKCGIELEQNTDTNRFFGGNLQADTWVSGSAAFCFNLTNPTVDIDADASEFYGVGVTGNPTYVWNAGQSQGHIFVGLNVSLPNSSNFHVAGGNPLYPAMLGGGGGTGAVPLFVNSFAISDQGQCTMSSGACAAQAFHHNYANPPNCWYSWSGNGTLTGLVKMITTTDQVTPTSTVGTDSAGINWGCQGQ
jgi:hypothetical protein